MRGSLQIMKIPVEPSDKVDGYASEEQKVVAPWKATWTAKENKQNKLKLTKTVMKMNFQIAVSRYETSFWTSP